jgi:hypothetical protein
MIAIDNHPPVASKAVQRSRCFTPAR